VFFNDVAFLNALAEKQTTVVYCWNSALHIGLMKRE